MIRARQLPEGEPWYWTDDTAMALTIVHALHLHGQIRPDEMAGMFGVTYQADPYRGYGYGMTVLLPQLAADPGSWETYAKVLFDGQGISGTVPRCARRRLVPGSATISTRWPGRHGCQHK